MRRRTSSLTVLVAWILLCTAGAVRADLSEFETWRFDLPDTDDEYPIDRLQAEYQPGGEEDWRSKTIGARVSNNCSSHDLCEMQLEAKIAQEVGAGFRFSYHYFHEEMFDHFTRWNELALGWRASGGQGVAFFYRPSFQKSQNDIGLRWGWLAGSRRGIELDVLFQAIANNRVAQRESLRGQERWIYQRNPPFFELRGYHDFAGTGRLDLQAALLSPTHRTHFSPAIWVPPPDYSQAIEGRRFRLRIDSPAWGPWGGGLEMGQKAGKYDRTPSAAPADSTGPQLLLEKQTNRDEWWIRPTIALRVNPRWRAIVLFDYRVKDETSSGPELPAEGYHYENISRSWKAGVSWDAKDYLSFDAGYAGSGISVTPTEDPDWIPETLRYGSRRENRLYFSPGFHRKHVAVLFTETFELDDEPYHSFLFHDKSFFQITLLQ
jgi:hypothetical protein